MTLLSCKYPSLHLLYWRLLLSTGSPISQSFFKRQDLGMTLGAKVSGFIKGGHGYGEWRTSLLDMAGCDQPPCVCFIAN